MARWMPACAGMTRRGGFTLVEMLVSVALVLLIMTLFAQAFGIAASSIKRQRGLAENDQRARSMVTILLGDLQKRTYRQRTDAVTEAVDLPADLGAVAQFVKLLEDRANQLSLGLVPLHPDYFIGGANDDGTVATTGATGGTGAAIRGVDDRERGYFHISEGDPSNDGDDVLKFTIDMAITELQNLDTSRRTGRAVRLLPTWNNQSDANPFNDVEANVNQPIWDDGIGWVEDPLSGIRRSYQPDETGTTASRLAEVALFIRGGNLYRRVNLIREPLEHVEGADVGEGQPTDDSSDPPGAGPLFFDPTTNPNYTFDSFWNDFDHGATRFDTGGTGHIFFNEVASLDNTISGKKTDLGGAYPAPPQRYWSLGDPRNRFGHDNTAWAAGGLQGRPKEYMDPSNPLTFIGAYTHEETSSPNFGYPGLPIYNGGMTSPMRWGSLPAGSPSDLNGDGRLDLLDDFDAGPRQGEDLLLANCHAFDLKVWDDALKRFVDIGHAAASGDLSLRAITDTGFPLDAPTSTPGRFQGAQWGMGRYGGLASTENRVFDTWHPAFNFTSDVKQDPVSSNPVVRPDNDPPPYRPLWTNRDNFGADFNDGGSAPNGSGPLPPPTFWEPDRNYTLADRVFPRPNLPDGPGTAASPPHMSFFYQLDPLQSVDVDGGGFRSPATFEQPQWPEDSGARTPPQVNSTTDDVTVWKAIPNTIGLKAIQITLRFFDPTSGQMRQLTLTHSFVEL